MLVFLSYHVHSSRIALATKDLPLVTMASANAWLQKQRKSDLADIADHVGLKKYMPFPL